VHEMCTECRRAGCGSSPGIIFMPLDPGECLSVAFRFRAPVDADSVARAPKSRQVLPVGWQSLWSASWHSASYAVGMPVGASDLGSLIERHRTEILALVRRYRGRSIAVFGSVARGEATPDSDVDFLVEFEPSSSLLDLVHLEEALTSCSVWRSTWSQRERCWTATSRSATTPSHCEPSRRSPGRRHGDGGRGDRIDRGARTISIRQ
jgi:predicted nucleotidyltransferase